MPAAAAATARPSPRSPMQKVADALRWLHLLCADIVAYGFLAALWAVSIGTVITPPRRLMQKAAASLRWIYFLAADIAVYGFLAAVWVGSAGGVAPVILGRLICGEGSAVSAAGVTVLLRSKFIIVRLLPGFLMQVLIRVSEYAEFNANEKDNGEREKLASSTAITEASAQRQLPERNGVQRLLPSHFMSHIILELTQLIMAIMGLGIRMKVYSETGSLGWRIGSVLLDVAGLGSVVAVGFIVVPNMVILATRFPGRRIGIM